MTANDWLSLVIVLICLLLSAFFAGSETALTASSRASMTRLEKHGNRRARIVNSLLASRERLIGALLLGNNAVNIAASALATGVFLAWFGPAGIVYATIGMTILVVVFSEVLPKTAAFNAPDRIALLVARPMQWVVRLLGPVLMAIEKLVRWLLKLFGKIRPCFRPMRSYAVRSICCTVRVAWKHFTSTCSAGCSICVTWWCPM
jgi:Mg2+/Co2+ transporter CorB